MRGVVAGLAVVMLMLLSTVPASAQDRTVRLTIDCDRNPEKLRVENTGTVPLHITGIHTVIGGEGDDSIRRVADRLAPGASITYQSGPAASGPHVLTRRFIFEREVEGNDDGAFVQLRPPEGVPDEEWLELKGGGPFLYCDVRKSEVSITLLTFRLTLYGTSPGKQRFWLDPQRPNLCWDPGFEIQVGPPCKAGGTTHTTVMPVLLSPSTTERANARWMRGSNTLEGRRNTFHTSKIVLGTDATHAAWYDFDTGRGGAGDGPEGQMPGGLPSTGGGGLAR
jgi:hypothetical protein